MRILFIISGLGLGGAERQVVLLSRELARRGHGVSIYTLNRELARANELDGCAVDLVVDEPGPAVLVEVEALHLLGIHRP